MPRMGFNWLIVGRIAGHAAPASEDDLAWLFAQGTRGLVRMSTHPQVSAAQVVKAGMEDLHVPVPDFTAPTQEQLGRIVRFMTYTAEQGKPVAVSCGAGLGRTGTVLACYLVSQGHSALTAIAEVRKKRPGSIETEDQAEAVKAFAGNHGKA